MDLIHLDDPDLDFILIHPLFQFTYLTKMTYYFKLNYYNLMIFSY